MRQPEFLAYPPPPPTNGECRTVFFCPHLCVFKNAWNSMGNSNMLENNNNSKDNRKNCPPPPPPRTPVTPVVLWFRITLKQPHV